MPQATTEPVMECTQAEKNRQLHEPARSTSPPNDHRDSCSEEGKPVNPSSQRVFLVILALAIAIFIVAMV